MPLPIILLTIQSLFVFLVHTLLVLRSVGQRSPFNLPVAARAGAAALVFICAYVTTKGVLPPIVRILALWAGTSFFWIALAYLGWGLNVFRRKAGWMDPFALITLLPALCLLWCWHTWRRHQYERTSRVLHNVYIGGFFSHEKQWTTVLDLTSEYPCPSSMAPTVTYENLPCLDNVAVPLSVLDEGAWFIEAHRHNGPLLVHCAIGRFRSARVIVHWLVKNQGYTEKDAWTLLKRARPHVQPPPKWA
jgi:protein-tyrosine phosphatase